MIGQGRAAELLMTGRAMNAEEGLYWDFFNRVVERLYREIRALRILEGATEVRKLVIAREFPAS